MSTTLADLRTEVRNRADLNNSNFITDSELDSYINYSLKELHALLVNSYGSDYFLLNTVMTVAANAEVTTENLPTGSLKINGVDLLVGSNYVTLQPFNFNERNRASGLNVQGQASGNYTNYRYRPRGRQIAITPKANGSLVLNVWYTPGIENLTTGSATVEENDTLNGWLEYVVVDACIKCKQKEETSDKEFMQQKQALIKRIVTESQNRDQGQPATVTDVYGTGMANNGFNPYDRGWDII